MVTLPLLACVSGCHELSLGFKSGGELATKLKNGRERAVRGNESVQMMTFSRTDSSVVRHTCGYRNCISRVASLSCRGIGRKLGRGDGILWRSSSGSIGWERGSVSRIVMRAGGDKNENGSSDDQVETLFMRELRRRGMSSVDSSSLGSAGTDTKTKEDGENDGSSDRGWSFPGTSKTKPPPVWTESQRNEQLKKSMALNSEGLDGLVPRASELLKLGSSFFLVFWPFITASLLAFLAVYLYFGPAFVHLGTSYEKAGRPPYVDPYQLLEEEVIPPEIGPDRVPYDFKTDIKSQ